MEFVPIPVEQAILLVESRLVIPIPHPTPVVFPIQLYFIFTFNMTVPLQENALYSEVEKGSVVVFI